MQGAWNWWRGNAKTELETKKFLSCRCSAYYHQNLTEIEAFRKCPPPLWDYFDEELRNFSRDSRRNDTKNSSVPTKIMVLDVAISTCIIVQLSGLVMIGSIPLKSRFGEKLWSNGACIALQLKRCAASSVFCRFISIGLMQCWLLNCISRIFVGIFTLVNGRALTVLLGSSSSLLHGTYSIFYRKDSI